MFAYETQILQRLAFLGNLPKIILLESSFDIALYKTVVFISNY